MTSFLDILSQTTNNTTQTLNGALANKSTGNPVLNLFANGGAYRKRSEDDIINLFSAAWKVNPKLALRALFYIRDIREGQGERRFFRVCIKWLAENSPTIFKLIVKHIPEYGRFDDMFVIDDYSHILDIVKNTIDPLLVKWLPSENTSSKQTRAKAVKLRKLMGLTSRQYRRRLSFLRSGLLEVKMAANKWDDIDFSKLPSQAFRKHIKAFKKHCGPRFSEFMDKVSKKEEKINTKTLYPYEILDLIEEGHREEAAIMWENLPDYTQGKNAIVVADTSGSMSGQPLKTAISLALYFAERNKGTFKDYFMSFSAVPKLHKVMGSNLIDKLRNIGATHWEQNTNVMSMFMAILRAAVKANAPQEDMPAILYIISDMEFDTASPIHTPFEMAKEQFEKHGYKLPHVVFWNVNSLSDQYPVTANDGFTTLISGCSANTFRYAVESKDPETLMLEVLNSDRYKDIDF